MMLRTTLALSLLAALAQAQLPFVETFDSGAANVGQWSVGPSASFPASGGNPGAWLSDLTDTFAPMARTNDSSSVFCGDYRARGVRSLGIDVLTSHVNFPFSREMTLMLANDSGTPGNILDDCAVYFLDPRRVPQVADGWKSFDFFVDSASPTMPAGWKVYASASGCTDPDTAWNTVMNDVSYVLFFWGDPELFYIFDQWTVGLDNARISASVPSAVYCLSKSNSQGCQPTVSLLGTPSATSAAPFDVAASGVLNQKTGLLFYGYGPYQNPFSGGTLCIAPPVKRTGGQNSGGNAGADDCSGQYSVNFNGVIQSGSDPLLLPGRAVFAQFWTRDPTSSFGTGLTDAGMFEIAP